jgi:putative Mg2+ transporter-C (MgtC) family protein
MLVTVYEWSWLPGASSEMIRTDPTRMAQGIMTGIGFLGAGVIFKEGLSVRGLTTAASIWITAAIGILVGVGLYFAATFATALTLGVLAIFHRIESGMPSHSYAHHSISFDRDHVMPEKDLRALLANHGFSVANMSYRIANDGRLFEYRMVIRTKRQKNAAELAASLIKLETVREFRISPTGD